MTDRETRGPRYVRKMLKNGTTLRAATGAETDASHQRFSMPRLSDGRAIVVWADTASEAEAIYEHWLAMRGLSRPASGH